MKTRARVTYPGNPTVESSTRAGESSTDRFVIGDVVVRIRLASERVRDTHVLVADTWAHVSGRLAVNRTCVGLNRRHVRGRPGYAGCQSDMCGTESAIRTRTTRIRRLSIGEHQADIGDVRR
jgi:hypothetical protein